MVSFGLPGDLSPTPPNSQFLDSLAYPIEGGGGYWGLTYPQLNVMKGKTEEKKTKQKGETVISCKYLFDFLCLTRLYTI